jgi:pimeloyl-ACP methyl ester carboxylesterase
MARRAVLSQLAAATRFRVPSELEPRTLVISSAKDAFTHPACPRALAAHLRAPIAVHPEAGHDIANDAPEWLASEVRRFAESR